MTPNPQSHASVSVDRGWVTRNDENTMFKDNRERVSRDKLADFFFGLVVFLIEPQTGGWLINQTLSKVTTVKGNDGTTHGK